MNRERKNTESYAQYHVNLRNEEYALRHKLKGRIFHGGGTYDVRANETKRTRRAMRKQWLTAH